MATIENCYHYTDCGLKNVWLENGCEEVKTPYGTGLSIDDFDGLHKAIAAAVIDKTYPLDGDELRFLRVEMDLSQKAFGEYVGKSDQSVAKWEKGEPIPIDVDYLIRHIYRQTMNHCSVYVDEVDRLHKLDKSDYQEWLNFKNEDGAWGKSSKKQGTDHG